MALAAGIAASVPSPAASSDDQRTVLIIYPFSRSLPATLEFDRGFQRGLEDHGIGSVTIYGEYLDLARFTGAAYLDAVENYLSEKYASRPPDVVLTAIGDGLQFMLERRSRLFPTTTLVHALVDRAMLESMGPLPADVVGVPSDLDFAGTIELALRLQPRTQRLVLVTGRSPRDLLLAEELRQEAREFADVVQLEELAALPLGEVLRRVGNLERDVVVVTPGMFGDVGAPTFPAESSRAIAALGTAPVYQVYRSTIGTGVVGGSMILHEDAAYEAGREVAELLRGADPTSLDVPSALPSAFHFDWRELRRWGIDEDRLPAGSIVHFRPPSLLEQHRGAVIVAVVVVAAQTALISLLLAERRRRRKAEAARNDLRGELAHASRLAVAGELMGSLAHEINQPLAAILMNADAAKLLLARGPEGIAELETVVAEIRQADVRASEVVRRLRALLAKKELERQPFDLHEAVREVKGLLLGEAERRGVTLEIDTEPSPKTVAGDRIQIQQVMINLLINAMDAVEGKPPGRRSVRAKVETTQTNAVLVVRDDGPGLEPDQLPKVFESFYTTKREGLGLGLSIARTIVEAHGGSIEASNHDGSGAEFRVALPLAPTASAAAEPARAPGR